MESSLPLSYSFSCFLSRSFWEKELKKTKCTGPRKSWVEPQNCDSLVGCSPGTGWVRNWVVGPGLPGLLLHLTLNRKQTKCLYVCSYSFKQWRLSSGLKLQICMVTLMLSEHIWKAGGILPLFPYSFISTSSGTKSCFSFALFCFAWLNSVWTKYDWQILVLRAQVPGILSITIHGEVN